MSDAAQYSFSISQNLMEVSIRSVDTGGLFTFDEAMEELRKLGVEHGLDEKRLREIFQSFPEIEEEVICKGTPPKHGENGRVEFSLVMDQKPRFIPDPESGKIDYREAMQVTLVEPGERIGEIVPPTQGEAGVNVRGEPVSAKDGNPTKVNLAEGVEQRGAYIHATNAGTPAYKNSRVSIRQVYEIQGDVDFSTGNVNFPGSVIVNGNVTDGFNILCGGELIVKGSVGSCHIQAKGAIRVFGGVLGHKKASIRSNTHVEVLFADACSITSDGNINITKDVVHAHVVALGEVFCKGSIIGGECLALKGIEAKRLGNNSGTLTRVKVRSHYKLERAVEVNGELLEQANKYQDDYNNWKNAPVMKNNILLEVGEALKNLRLLIQKKQNIDTQIKKLEKEISEEKEVAMIRVSAQICSDVVLEAPHCRTVVNEEIKGRKMIMPDISTGEMLIKHG
jgi:uncharacterized protein (DUF342 family)